MISLTSSSQNDTTPYQFLLRTPWLVEDFIVTYGPAQGTFARDRWYYLLIASMVISLSLLSVATRCGLIPTWTWKQCWKWSYLPLPYLALPFPVILIHDAAVRAPPEAPLMYSVAWSLALFSASSLKWIPYPRAVALWLLFTSLGCVAWVHLLELARWPTLLIKYSAFVLAVHAAGLCVGVRVWSLLLDLWRRVVLRLLREVYTLVHPSLVAVARGLTRLLRWIISEICTIWSAVFDAIDSFFRAVPSSRFAHAFRYLCASVLHHIEKLCRVSWDMVVWCGTHLRDGYVLVTRQIVRVIMKLRDALMPVINYAWQSICTFGSRQYTTMTAIIDICSSVCSVVASRMASVVEYFANMILTSTVTASNRVTAFITCVYGRMVTMCSSGYNAVAPRIDSVVEYIVITAPKCMSAISNCVSAVITTISDCVKCIVDAILLLLDWLLTISQARWWSPLVAKFVVRCFSPILFASCARGFIVHEYYLTAFAVGSLCCLLTGRATKKYHRQVGTVLEDAGFMWFVNIDLLIVSLLTGVMSSIYHYVVVFFDSLKEVVRWSEEVLTRMCRFWIFKCIQVTRLCASFCTNIVMIIWRSPFGAIFFSSLGLLLAYLQFHYPLTVPATHLSSAFFASLLHILETAQTYIAITSQYAPQMGNVLFSYLVDVLLLGRGLEMAQVPEDWFSSRVFAYGVYAMFVVTSQIVQHCGGQFGLAQHVELKELAARLGRTTGRLSFVTTFILSFCSYVTVWLLYPLAFSYACGCLVAYMSELVSWSFTAVQLTETTSEEQRNAPRFDTDECSICWDALEVGYEARWSTDWCRTLFLNGRPVSKEADAVVKIPSFPTKIRVSIDGEDTTTVEIYENEITNVPEFATVKLVPVILDETVTRCGHVFHEPCLREWIRAAVRSPVCPLCRESLQYMSMRQLLF
eukprot:GEMP01014186.1.p1 GENE.GEMP01014186.1~~GEMP01014186.1.p1  ORF type:complete len:920 (+),score=116.63 GEMP01014186.1:165-2924(+)